METKPTISDSRKSLDETLASQQALASKDSIRELLQTQLHSSPSQLQEKRIAQVSNLVDILKSASGDDFKSSKTHGTTTHGAWKLKLENEVQRVMYREGPQGSPFHTLLTEICVEAPVDVCLCTGWEVSLYKNWWPRVSFPTFKLTTACCLKKVRIDEQICQIRMKVPWPLSDRELVLEYFEMEFLEDGLVIVLLTSISETESVEKDMQKIAKEEIPKAKDAVKMDLTGGFAIKKIASNISFCRTVGNLDLKMDFAPPSLINFISRQLLGEACKLFQKTTESVAKGDKDYEKVLEGPLYVRLRDQLYLNSKLKNSPGPKALQSKNSENHDVHVTTPV